MELDEGSGLKDMDATDMNQELEEAEVSNSDINMDEHAESSDSSLAKESDLKYAKGETGPRHVTDSAHNAMDIAYTTEIRSGEANLDDDVESTIVGKKEYRNAGKPNPETDEVINPI